MRKIENVVNAKFVRTDSLGYIDVSLHDIKRSIYLYGGCIESCAKTLTEIEIEQLVTILKRWMVVRDKREVPEVFNDMLSDLCDVQIKRAGVRIQKGNERRKTCTSFRLNKYELEELLKQYKHCGHNAVHIESILAGSNRHNTETIVFDYGGDSVLGLNYSVEDKEDK